MMGAKNKFDPNEDIPDLSGMIRIYCSFQFQCQLNLAKNAQGRCMPSQEGALE